MGNLTDHVLTHGLAASSLRPLATAAGVSDRMLLYYFEDKTAILVAVFAEVEQDFDTFLKAMTYPRRLTLEALLEDAVPKMLETPVWPILRLWLEAQNLAGHGDADCQKFAQTIARRVLSWASAHSLSREKGADSARFLVSLNGMAALKAAGMQDTGMLAV